MLFLLMHELRSSRANVLYEDDDPMAMRSASGLMYRASWKTSVIGPDAMALKADEMVWKDLVCVGSGIGAGTKRRRERSSSPPAHGTCKMAVMSKPSRT